MDLVRNDVRDLAALERAHEVLLAVDAHDRPWATSWAREHFVRDLQDPMPQERRVLVTALEGGRTVGTGVLSLPMRDNLRLAWLAIWVRPDQRRRGVGSALTVEMVRLAVDDGRTELIGIVYLPADVREQHGNALFAAHHGFDPGLVQLDRHLELPVPADLLDALEAESAGQHGDYDVRTFAGGVPPELRESYCRASNTLAVEAPGGDIGFEEDTCTAADLEEWLGRLADAGDELLTTVAVDAAGDVVAYTDLLVHAHSDTDVGQLGTLVVPGHRGHRLGLAVKVRGLRELQRRHPGRRRVTTSNAEVNAHMVAINERLGFRPLEVMTIYRRVVERFG